MNTELLLADARISLNKPTKKTQAQNNRIIEQAYREGVQSLLPDVLKNLGRPDMSFDADLYEATGHSETLGSVKVFGLHEVFSAAALKEFREDLSIAFSQVSAHGKAYNVFDAIPLALHLAVIRQGYVSTSAHEGFMFTSPNYSEDSEAYSMTDLLLGTDHQSRETFGQDCACKAIAGAEGIEKYHPKTWPEFAVKYDDEATGRQSEIFIRLARWEYSACFRKKLTESEREIFCSVLGLMRNGVAF